MLPAVLKHTGLVLAENSRFGLPILCEGSSDDCHTLK